MTTGETIALTLWTSVGKVTSLLFNMLSRFVIAFFLFFVIAFFQGASFFYFHGCSDFGAPQIKSVIAAIVSPSICHEVMGPDTMILVFEC